MLLVNRPWLTPKSARTDYHGLRNNATWCNLVIPFCATPIEQNKEPGRTASETLFFPSEDGATAMGGESASTDFRVLRIV